MLIDSVGVNVLVSNAIWTFSRYQRYGRTYCRHLHITLVLKLVAIFVPKKRWYPPLSPHGVTVQNNNIHAYTAVRNTDLIY